MPRHLPVLDESILDRIDIASPCPADWERMRGDERVRFCGQCRQHVYDLSAMSRAEAVALLAEKEGRACVRLRRRPDGRVVSADCGERLRAARRRGLWAYGVALTMVGIAHLALKLFGLHLAWSWLGEHDGRRTLGDVVVDERPLMGAMMPMPPLPAPDPSPVMGEMRVAPPAVKMGKIRVAK